jgi:uncharacterized damage-inducible protein DinB
MPDNEYPYGTNAIAHARCGLPRGSTTKGMTMSTSPYRELMHYKRWATNGLHAVLKENLARLGEDDRTLILLLLDHIHSVDEIFSRNLEGRDHGYLAPRSAELPSFEVLESEARSTSAWYVDYVGGLSPEKLEATIDFTFSNGTPGRMTRGEMILHVSMHGAGHRGQIALLLQKNGIQPFQDRMTDFVEAGEMCSDGRPDCAP